MATTYQKTFGDSWRCIEKLFVGGKKSESDRRPRLTFCMLAGALAASTLPLSHAEAASFEDWLQQPTMTGTWGGLRTSLANEGIAVNGGYVSQFGDDAVGGMRQGFDYTQQFTLGADWDLQKLLGLNGGILHTYVEDRVGRGINSDYVGGKIEEDTFYGSGENFRLMEFAYEQQLLANRVDLLGGYFVMSNEFASEPLLCASGFLSNAFCGHPQFLAVDTGYQVGPVADWGGRIKVFVTPHLSISTGAFEDNPELLDNNKGFDLQFSGATGAMVPVEIAYTAKLGPDALVGHYKIGGIYDTSQVQDAEYPTTLRSGRYEGYLMADQMVYRSGVRSLTLFGEAGIADKRTALEDSWLTAGFILKAPFAARPNDNLHVGWAHATVNPRELDAQQEALAAKGITDDLLEPVEEEVEVGYNIQATPWFSFTPDVQYVLNPGATVFKHYPDAWVFGAQTQLIF